MAIQIIIIVFVLFAISRVLLQFRAKKITTHEFVSWILFWFAGGVVTVYPDLASRLASFLGVGRGADLVIYGALLVVFYILFRIIVRLERVQRDITKIVREIALEKAKDWEKT